MSLLKSSLVFLSLLLSFQAHSVSMDFCKTKLKELISRPKRHSHLYTKEEGIITEERKVELLEHAKQHRFNERNLKLLEETLAKITHELPQKDLKYYITFVENFRLPKRRAQAIKDMIYLSDAVPKSKFVQKYFSIEKIESL